LLFCRKLSANDISFSAEILGREGLANGRTAHLLAVSSLFRRKNRKLQNRPLPQDKVTISKNQLSHDMLIGGVVVNISNTYIAFFLAIGGRLPPCGT
jgi:hypothetical protein